MKTKLVFAALYWFILSIVQTTFDSIYKPKEGKFDLFKPMFYAFPIPRLQESHNLTKGIK